jgi:hypothetical protein
MPKKTKAKRKVGANKRSTVKKTKSVNVVLPAAGQLPPVTRDQVFAAKRQFVRGILVRREAVQAGEKLPPGATHEIIGHDEAGSPVLKRRRYSLR